MNIELILLGAIILFIIGIIITFSLLKSGKKIKITSLEPGAKFDNYAINRFIKRGGMATVFEASNVKTGEVVALKIMHESLMDDADLVDKFLREGDILENLNRKYPNAPIVKVYRHSRENNERAGRPFIALELVEGIDLDNFLLNNKLNVEQSLEIVSKILDALKVAHNEGILHRDISPGNIMVDFMNGNITQVKMIDFGVAKNEYMNKNTPDSSIHGKPPFMSPEQCRNEKLDKRSDLYSLGILFYTMLTGKPPFMSKNPLEVMSMHQTNQYPPLPEDLSKPIRNIIQSLLEKDIISRYQSAGEVIADLEKENLIKDKNKNISININDISKNKIIVDEPDEFIISEKVKPKKLIFNNRLMNYVIIASLVILFIITGYYTINEFNYKNDTLILKQNELIQNYINQLRDLDVKINYQFIELEKESLFKSGAIMESIIIDKELIKDGYLSIKIGIKNDE